MEDFIPGWLNPGRNSAAFTWHDSSRDEWNKVAVKTFSAQPGPSALLEYCRIRPGLRLVLQSNQVCTSSMRIFNAYGALLCALTERKPKENWLEQEYPSFLRNNMTSSNKCAKNVLVWYMYKHGPLRSLHGHGPWRLFFWNFQGGDSCTFSQGFRRFSENLRWPYRDEMAGCLHGELYAFSSRARHVNTCTHTDTNRVELIPGWVSSRDEILHVNGP